MGMLKRMKDMSEMVQAAPGMIQQAQQLGAQAQEMAAAQQAAAMAQMGGMQAGAMPGVVGAQTGPDFEPIAGVSIDLYVEISKGIAAFGYDQSKLVDVAASKGVSQPDWDQAASGWAERIKRNPAVGQRFNQIYRAG